jgi:hypothetical protein
VTNAIHPLDFLQRSLQDNIDHMISDSMLTQNSPGAAKGQTHRNIAPLPTEQNKSAKATSCSTTLATGGTYHT